MFSRGVVISIMIHGVVAGGLLAFAKTGTLQRATSVVVLSDSKPKPKPKMETPKPKKTQPPKPKPLQPEPTKLATPPAASPSSLARAASALASFEMSNDNVAPGAMSVAIPKAITPPRSLSKTTKSPRNRGRESDDSTTPCDETPSKPEPIYKVEIQYLASARAEGIEGRLVLRIFVAANGSVSRVEVLSSVEPALDAAAIASVKQWRFTPSKACGRPVDGGVYTIARKFELGD
ncbi:MAG: energy transducer TonB [Deltaproteobacteria bacterium]|nr:energy transducer TonB [Deltaproteobacteria bacterium]